MGDGETRGQGNKGTRGQGNKEEGDEKMGENGSLVLNPIHRICTFEYPIPEIIEKIKHKKPLGKIIKQKTSVIIYRDPKDLSVRFIELSDGAFAYLQMLEAGFPMIMVPMLLAQYYSIDESNEEKFNKELNGLVKTLVNSRILICNYSATVSC